MTRKEIINALECRPFNFSHYEDPSAEIEIFPFGDNSNIIVYPSDFEVILGNSDDPVVAIRTSRIKKIELWNKDDHFHLKVTLNGKEGDFFCIDLGSDI